MRWKLTRYLILGCLAALLGAGIALPAEADGQGGWVVYSNELNWLRVEPQKEFDKPLPKHKEIWGGRSQEPVKKILIKGGFDSSAKALKFICGQLTRVRLKHHGMATPKWTTNALYKGKEYNLRLVSGDVGMPHRGMEYDLDAEIQVLRTAGGITPRIVFGPQYLCHVIEMGTRWGPKKLDEWMCQPFLPQPPPEDLLAPRTTPPDKWTFAVPDGLGGYRIYTCDRFEGPFMHNYALARALKEVKADKVKLWPPTLKKEVYASDVPEDARDFGIATESAQPHVADPRMLEWVVYATEMGWLRIGTKTEFEQPRPRSQEIWGGRSNEPIPKKLVLKETFHTYEQGARALCAGMTKVKWRYVHNNRPNWVALGTVRGKAYDLQLARDPKLLVVSGIGYDHNAERALLARFGITPKLTFADQYLVFSEQMSTYSGPRKTERWMMTIKKPEKGHVAVPDGTGGWFVHKVRGGGMGPIKDSWDLAKKLKAKKVKSIALAGSRIHIDPSWVPDNPRDRGERAKATKPKLTKVIPDKAMQGKELYVTLYGKEIEYGATIDFGKGIRTQKLTYFGRDPKSDDEQWLLTLLVAGDAEVGKHDVSIENYDSGATVGRAMFEVLPAVDPQCPFVDLPAVAGNAGAATARAAQKKAIKKLEEARKGLHDWQIKLITEEQSARKAGTLQTSHVQVRLKLMGHRRVDALQEIEKIAARIRKAEADWAKSLKEVGGGLSRGARRALIEQCRERAECLRGEMFKRLEDLKKVDRGLIMAMHPELGRHYQKYATSRNDLFATLELMSVLFKLENEVAGRDRRDARRTGKGLAAAQWALYRAYVDHAEWALQTIEMKGITALEAQKHYGYAVAALRKKGEKTPWMDSIVGDAAQTVMSSANYILAGFGDAWAAFKDGVVNMLPDSFLDLTSLETQAQKIDGEILKARKAFDEKLAYVRGLRKLSPQSARGARAYLIDPAKAELVSRGHSMLMADRAFHELTDGGLFRILGAFDVDRTDHLETELLAAIHHGRLTVRDMQRSLNAEMGRVPETGKLSLKGLIDPMRVVRIIKADERGVFADKHVFITTKRAEVEQEMAQLLPRWRKIGYDFTKVAGFLPKNFKHHTDLIWNNEDYCQFWVRVLMFEHEEALDTLANRVEEAKDPQMLRALETLRKSSQSHLAKALRPYLTRAYQLQAQTKIICRDFLGAVAAMEQAYKVDPKLAQRVKREDVMNALLSEEVRGRAMDMFHQLGNQGFSAALSAKIMQLVGPAVAAKPMSFTQFLYGQVNPFAEVLTAEGAWNVVENLGEELAQDVAGQAMEKHIGLDKAYAEWAAGILVRLTNQWGQELGARGVERLRKSRLFESAEALNAASAAMADKRPDTDADLEASRKKSDFEERVADLTVVAAAEKQRQSAETEYRKAAAKHGAESKEANAARGRLLDSEADVHGRTRLLTEKRVESALAKYEAKAKKEGWNLKYALRLFRRLPLAKLRALKRAGKLPPELEKRVDAARLKMMDALQREVVNWSKGDVVCLVITGAAANPDGPEYAMKLLDSDVDFTFLTRPGVSDKRLAEIEARYLEAVADACGRSPMELADSTGFCDKLHAGYDLKTLADITEANVTNPERYLNLGSTQFVLFMNKVAGRFKAFNKKNRKWETLSLDANGKIFGHQKFETWMGADIALEQFRFREAHREHRGADVAGFLKDQGKYTVRVALGKLISDPDGCARINAMTPQEAIEAGGLHAAIIRVARKFEGKLFTSRQIAFLEQCNQLKKGARAEEVFGVSGDAVNDAIRRHNQEANAFFDDALPAALRSQQQAMVAMESEGSSAADREQAAKILLAQAWALSRLEPRHREHLSRLSGEGKAMTSSHAALELAKDYRQLVPPAAKVDRHQPAPEKLPDVQR